ncbi:antiterminator LoaP [Adlercreutzia sp. ZJ138]|uniref:antiterminator LoaP n=1 Tax=Adlercreutzia sp. ZJ138 TaxID=2709405 RepID=UPI0013ED4752|nr:antiterminator LoaP [Adlercreutzia sp. ZJ138]
MAPWYAVQVFTGQEDKAVGLIGQTLTISGEENLVDEVFVPKRKTLTKQHGELVEGETALFPGYIMVVTSKVERLSALLGKVPAFTRLLGTDGMFTPLAEGEVAWICAFTQRKHRTVEMSEGFVEGGRVVVASGPLVGREALIKKVNRRKREATLELSILGRTVEVKVGLSLVRKKQ